MSAPNPGSDTAIAVGCVCPRFDNNRGRYAPYPPDGWWISSDCPVHAPQNQEAATSGEDPSPTEQRAV